jgi:heptose-I-phosphate ethanolaminephosphotransferase
MNSSFQDLSNFEFDADRPYNLTDFIHSFSELNSIRFKGFDSKKSIFSEDFESVSRKVGQDFSYED